MFDIDDQVRRVWNPDVRPLIVEAWKCYGVGAYRATIMLTWLAVCEDLTEKISRLADDGCGVKVRKLIDSARLAGLSAIGIQSMQNLERDLLKTAADLELVDTITARELERLREDRHLCVHPSLRGETYEPRAESARQHLVASLSGVLTLPVTQGRKTVDRFASYVADPSFTPTSDYLLQTFFDNVRQGARKGIVELAAKHALLELQATEPTEAWIVADRMAMCLRAFVNRDRTSVRDALAKSLDRFNLVDGKTLFRALGRLGELDVFWEVVDGPLTLRMADMVSALQPPDDYGNLDPGQVEVLSLVASPSARHALPGLEKKFAGLHIRSKAAVISHSPSCYFGDYIPALLASAGGWRLAEETARNALVPMGPFLTSRQLAEILDAWASNDQCRTAVGMLSIAVDFYLSTGHLRPRDQAIWRGFIDKVKLHEGPVGPYTYVALEMRLSL